LTEPTESTSQGAGEGEQVSVDEELREDALDVLRDALTWRLEPARWAVVAQRVDALAVAVAAGDAEAVRAAVDDLERAGPVRAGGVGEPPVEVPSPVRAGLTELIRTLDGRAAAGEL
jgi:hypothetical protein